MQSRSIPQATAIAVGEPNPRRGLLFTFVAVIMLALATLASLSIAPDVVAQDSDTNISAADVAEQVQDTAVTIYTYQPGGLFSPGQTGREPSGSGSGWVYSDDGLVVTNAHVVLEAEEVLVVLSDGTQIPASIVGTDWSQDVAVLQLEPDGGQELPPTATVGDSSEVRAGDEVIAIGTPLGQFANTVSVGHVGATDRALNTRVGYSVQNLIQHDASLSPGNSGGPLFSMDGEVIGMNVAKVDALSTGQQATDDISFAIDSNAVVAVVEEIVANGFVSYPYLGITTQMTMQGTAVVDSVEEDAPAEAAGVQAGDIIVGIDGDQISRNQPFIDVLYQHDPGDTVTLEVERDEEVIELEVELGTRPVEQ